MEPLIHTCNMRYESRRYGSGTQVEHVVLKGTSEQIAAHVADSVKRQLDGGESKRVELLPIAPWSIVDLTS